MLELVLLLLLNSLNLPVDPIQVFKRIRVPKITQNDALNRTLANTIICHLYNTIFENKNRT